MNKASKNTGAGIGIMFYISCIYLAFFLYSPNISVKAIKQGLQQKNAALVEDYIDFESIQNSVKAQLKAEIILSASEQKNRGEITGTALMMGVSNAIKMVEDFVELFLSKEGIARLFEKDREQLNKPNSREFRKLVSSLQSEAFIESGDFEFTSYRTIQVKGFTKNGKKHRFIFTFRYLRWVLTDIIIDWQNVDNKKVIKFIRNFQQG